MRKQNHVFIQSVLWARLALPVLACACASIFLVTPHAAFAQDPGLNPLSSEFGLESEFTEVGVQTDRDIKSIVATVINITLGFLGIIAVILIIYAGFMWMTARGNEEQVARAKLILRNAIIGLVIILSAWGIAWFIISRLGEATGGGGGGSGGGGGGIPGVLPADRLTAREFQTAHGGDTNAEDVYLCSNVQSRFNHWLNQNSVTRARGRSDLKIVRTQESSNPIDPVENIGLDVESRNNIIRFALDRPGVNENIIDEWPAFSRFEVHIPKSLADVSGKSLTDCTAFGCEDRGDYFAWPFSTENNSDAVRPDIISAYPPLPEIDTSFIGERDEYPDQDVDRNPTFVINFTESIDFFSVVDENEILISDNIKVEQVIHDGSNVDLEQARHLEVVGEAIPSEHFDVSLSNSGVQFTLNSSHQSSLNDGPYLDPYTWYRVTAQNITDLCGNSMAGIFAWVFQTNGDIPGVAFTYPRDNYKYACPDTETFIQFRTSMYNIKNSSCLVSPNSGGLVTRGSGIENRELEVSDNVPPQLEGGPLVNPNEFCRKYDFGPINNELTIDTTYTPVVDYRDPRRGGRTEEHTWTFEVKPPEQCANAPYITRLSPSVGPWGRCLTIQGKYFGEGDVRTADDAAYTRLALDSARNAIVDEPENSIPDYWLSQGAFGGISLDAAHENWHNTYISGTFPGTDFAEEHAEYIPEQNDVDFELFVVKNQVLGGQSTPLESNHDTFTVFGDDEPYTGVCLFSLNPARGPWGQSVSIRGQGFTTAFERDFTGGFGPRKVMLNNLEARIAYWKRDDDTEIRITIPEQGQDGLVRAQTASGISNGLPFDVAGGIGAACSAEPIACIPDSNLCTTGLVCGTSCTCKLPPREVGFRIEQAWPRSGCQDSCVNAEVGLRANVALKQSSLQPATFSGGQARSGGSLAIRKCLDDVCESLEPFNSTFTIQPLTEDGQKLVMALDLETNTRYRVIVYGASGGIRSVGNTQLLNLNYDSDGDGAPDAYSWSFRTGTAECVINRIALDKSRLSLYEQESSDVYATAYGPPNACASRGQIITPPDPFSFTWRACKYNEGDIGSECTTTCPAPLAESGEPVLSVGTGRRSQTVVTGERGTKDNSAKGLVCGFYEGAVIKDGAAVTVRSYCENDIDCTQGNICSGSICNKTGPNAGRCTPTITEFNPPGGRPGTWVTIEGCYFGNTRGTVTYRGGIALGVPDPEMCLNTWSDNFIISEVPEGTNLGTGKIAAIKHEREDGQAIQSSQDFTVNGNVYPGLCHISPDYGAPGVEVALFGKSFSEDRDVENDDVTFGSTPATEITSWSDVKITVEVPDVPAGAVGVRVVKSENASGNVAFRATGRRTSTGPEDFTARLYSPNPGPACRSGVLSVLFSGLIDQRSLARNFIVRENGSIDEHAGEIRMSRISGNSTSLSFIPSELFDLSATYEIIVKAGTNGLRSISGGEFRASAEGPCTDLSSGECVISVATYTNGEVEKRECAPTQLKVEPLDMVYTAPGQEKYNARIYTKGGDEVAVPDATYTWSSSDTTILNFASTASNTYEQEFRIFSKNGSTLISASVDQESDLANSTEARVFLCGNPWPASMAQDQVPFHDKSGSDTFLTEPIETNFSTFYCRDKGSAGTEDDLPGLEEKAEIAQGETRDVESLLKEVFLLQPDSTDAIGIRVLENQDNLSIRNWYNQQGYDGSPQPVAIDKFEALRDGRTIYVAAPNDTMGETDPTIYNNIYLISVNDNASPETTDIYNQMVDNWRFLVNVSGDNEKQKLRNDLERIKHARLFADILRDKEAVPLASGSFEKGLSLSVWPSWNAALSSDFGASLPHDPIESISCESAEGVADTQTCWKPGTPGYECDNDKNYIYLYNYDNSNSSFVMNLEYTTKNKWNSLQGGKWQNTANICMDKALKIIK